MHKVMNLTVSLPDQGQGEVAQHVLPSSPVAGHVDPVGAAQDRVDVGGDGAVILTPGWETS